MFVNKYPYTDMHELNLDWLLGQMLQLRTDMKDFVKLNTIKYADPIRWNITSQYEGNTVVVDGDGNAYLSTQPVPAGVNINNTDYWTNIGNFSELFDSVKESIAAADEGSSTYASANRSIGDLVWLSDKLYEVTQAIATGESYVVGTNCDEITIEDFVNDKFSKLPTLPVYNVADYGMMPDTNIYDQLFDFLRNVISERGGGIVFFPKGTYTLDYTIMIPDNCIFIGEGDQTCIYFDCTDTHIGCALLLSGSNIVIRDMSVEINSTGRYAIRGDLPNCIGISDFDYDRMTEKRGHTLYHVAGHHNMSIINVNCPTSNYGIQIEPWEYAVSDIFIINHNCPNGMFSSNPVGSVEEPTIKNVYVNNMICDTVRLSDGKHGCENYNINGLTCTQIACVLDNVTINNFVVNALQGNRTADSLFHAQAVVAIGKNVKLSNGTIKRTDASVQTMALYTGGNENTVVFLDNIFIDDVGAPFTNANYSQYAKIYWNNCNFLPINTSYQNTLTNYVGSKYGANPLYIKINSNPGGSIIGGACVYNSTDTSYKIGTIPAGALGEGLVKRAFGTGIIYNPNDATVIPQPVQIEVDPTTGDVVAQRHTIPTGKTYDTLNFVVSW